MQESPLQKKRKTVTWSETVNSLLENHHNSSLKKSRRAKVVLSESDREFATHITTHLEHSLIALLIFKLSPFKRQGKLYKLIEYDNFRIFNWAVENYNLQLMNYLVENLSHTQSYLTLRNHDYAAFKKLIAVSKNLKWDDIADKIIPVLEAILKIKPNDELLEVIQDELSKPSEQMNSDTIKNLQAYIHSQIVANPDSMTNASVLLGCKSSLINKKQPFDLQTSIHSDVQQNNLSLQNQTTFRP